MATSLEVDMFRPARLEMEKRPIRVKKIEVLTYKSGADPQSNLSFPGTATVFVARKGTKGLDQVRAAVEAGEEGVKTLRAAMEKQFNRVTNLTPEEYAAQIPKEPVFAGLRYGGSVLTSGIFLPKGLDLHYIVFPYNGGRLAAGGFSLAEHYKEGSKAELEALVVKTEPPLTPAERAALKLVPSDQLARNVAIFDDCHTTWWAAAFFFGPLVVATAVATGAYVTLTAAAAALVGLAKEQHLTDAKIQALGPAATARALLGLRRQALEASTKSVASPSVNS